MGITVHGNVQNLGEMAARYFVRIKTITKTMW